MPTFDVNAIRADFPNLSRTIHDKPLVYFDNAATTLKPQAVIDAVCNHYSQGTSNVHRGVHTLSEEATSRYEGARDIIQRFINAESREEIILTSGTTDSINLVAQSYRKLLNEGDEILITEMEHHSNIVPWQMLAEQRGCVLKVAPMNDQGELIFDEFKKLLNEKTKIVSVVYVSNSLGTVNPVKEIIEEAHKVGAKVLLDGAQAVTHTEIDVVALNCDFFAFSAHKLYGPTGVGVLYGKKELLDAMPPYRGGGDMIASVTFEKTTYNVLPYKFEAGTPNVAGVIGLGAAIEYLNTIGVNNTLEYKKELLSYATDKLSNLDGLKIIGEASNKTSLVSFVLDFAHAHDVGTIVNETGVAIRTGHHCTQPVMKHFKAAATSRASFAMYNTKEEIDVLVVALNKVKEIFA